MRPNVTAMVSSRPTELAYYLTESYRAMALYSSATKKGSLNGARGPVKSKSFQCDKFTVDEKGRSFQIQLTDDETGKTHSINLYGDEVLELHQVLDSYVRELDVG